LRLVEKEQKKDDPEPKAFACYGIDLRYQGTEEVWIRFVEGNPKSGPTIDFMKWTLKKTAEQGIQVLLMFWTMLLGIKVKGFNHGFVSTIKKLNKQERARDF
jgi:hypothetical protein